MKSFSIRIRNLINPHHFYFHLNKSAIEEIDEILHREEHKLKDYDGWYHPQKDEIVAVFIKKWNKLVRAQIDFIFQDVKNGYLIWCLDYGYLSIK